MPQKIRLPQQNSVILIGRLTRDPDLKYTQKGTAVCKFDIAINHSYKDTTGEWKDEASYVPVTVWSESAVRCIERIKKGSPVHIAGRLRSRSWEDKNQQKHTTLEVVAQRVQFLEITTVAEGHVQEAPVSQTGPDKLDSPADKSGAEEPSVDEEIPF